jgi:hypothetical protein
MRWIFRICALACHKVPSPFFAPIFLLLVWAGHTIALFLMLYSFLLVALSIWFIKCFVMAPFDGGMALFRFCEEVETIATYNQVTGSVIFMAISGFVAIYLIANYGEASGW